MENEDSIFQQGNSVADELYQLAIRRT